MFGKNLTSKSSKNKIFRRFCVFEYVLWQQMKTRKCRKSSESFLNKKTPIVKLLPLLENWQKAITLLSKYNFGFNNKKNYFKFQ